MKIGDAVFIEFYDHAHHTKLEIQNVIKCEVYGRLVQIDRLSITVRSWGVLDPSAEGDEMFSILKSTILTKRVLR